MRRKGIGCENSAKRIYCEKDHSASTKNMSNVQSVLLFTNSASSKKKSEEIDEIIPDLIPSRSIFVKTIELSATIAKIYKIGNPSMIRIRRKFAYAQGSLREVTKSTSSLPHSV